MKSLLQTTTFFTLLALYTLIQSCNQPIGDKIKVPDFRTLKTLFREPPAEYTTAPFFVWNAEITKPEIDKFLTGFSEQGSRQVFIHPRPGLITEYLSDEWLEMFRYTVEKGKDLGMKVWIYDENSYPSGFGGGHVPASMPESYNQGQGLVMTKVDMLPDTVEKYYLVLRESDGKWEDITADASLDKGKTGKYFLFSRTYNGKSDWYGGFSYVDLLYPGVTQKFIEVTMTGYEKVAGDEFGITVPGTFTDEPQLGSPGGIRFTPDMFEVFSSKWGYDLRVNLPSLYEEVGDWKKVRHNYVQTLLDMFIDRWAKPWYELCELKGLKFTGHYWEHEWPNIWPGGDNMAMYIWHQLPAIDMLFNQFNDSLPGAQFGNIRAVKELASAANQSGRSRKLSETYGGSGWDLTFTDMKRNGDWEYALGVNLMNQHLTYFSMEGARKYDYPPSFDYHEPWWDHYRYINDHYARLSLALSAGKQVNDILVLEPTTTAWLYGSYVKSNHKLSEIGQSFQSFITKLEKSQVEYDLGSENIMKNLGSASGGKMYVGNAVYTRFVIPPMTENLDNNTLRLLKSFVSSGGTVIAFSVPSLVDGVPDGELKEIFENRSDRMVIVSDLNSELIEKYFSGDLLFSATEGGVLYHHTRNLNDGRIVFLVNSDTEAPLKGNISLTGLEAVKLNTLTGEMSGYRCVNEDGRISLEYNLPPAGSLLLFVPGKKPVKRPYEHAHGTLTVIKPSSELKIKRDRENVLTIDFCDLTLGGETLRDIYFYNAADRVFKYHGFKNGNPWNTSVQYRRNIVDRDTFGVNSGFTAAYHFTVEGDFDYSSFSAVVERPWLWSVTLNGTEIKPADGEWWLDRAFGVFRIGDLVKQGVNTLTIKASPMKIHAEIETVYILGDFSVVPSPKGWTITAPAENLAKGSWITQGLPFYSWGVTYTSDFNIEKPQGHYEVSLPDWKGTIAVVTVNGTQADYIAFPPYRTDVSQFITPGVNTVEVKIIGSLRNLQGPFHNNPPVGFASPWNWRYVKEYPAGNDYKMYDYGLMDDIFLLTML